MHETEKPSFFQTIEFNTWLITSFFNVFVAVFLVMLPMAGIHTLGVAAGTELSRYEKPAERKIAVPKAAPDRQPMEGVPVAYSSYENVP